MRMVRLDLLLVSFLLAGSFAGAQDSSSPAPENGSRLPASALTAPAPAEPAPPAATLNDVMDRVVQREHYFMAQMRHMHPMVETYLQDLKTDSDGHSIPVK